MCLKKQDLYNKFKARVQAASVSARSPWVESESLDYLFEGRSAGKGCGDFTQGHCCPTSVLVTVFQRKGPTESLQ